MSLSLIHVVFVAAAILLSAVAGALLVSGYGGSAGAISVGLGSAWFLCGLALVFYGRRVIAKLRRLERGS